MILTRTTLPSQLEAGEADVEPHRPAPRSTFVLYLQPEESDEIIQFDAGLPANALRESTILRHLRHCVITIDTKPSAAVHSTHFAMSSRSMPNHKRTRRPSECLRHLRHSSFPHSRVGTRLMPLRGVLNVNTGNYSRPLASRHSDRNSAPRLGAVVFILTVSSELRLRNGERGLIRTLTLHKSPCPPRIEKFGAPFSRPQGAYDYSSGETDVRSLNAHRG
jgi:hypothetical protein